MRYVWVDLAKRLDEAGMGPFTVPVIAEREQTGFEVELRENRNRELKREN